MRSRDAAAALVSALLIGLVTDQWLRTGAFGIGASLTFVLGALVVVWIGGLERFESRALVALAAVFACWFTLRASPWLLAPDLLVAISLLGFAASTPVPPPLPPLPLSHLGPR